MKGRRARGDDRLLELDEVERRLKPFGRRYLGVRQIRLDALVGTDGRASSFTRDFRPLHAFSRERLRSLQSAFADGGFRPIVTVKLGESYFVIDGHHRAADWHDAVYTPTLAAIERLRVGRLYRDAPAGDLFLVLHRHRRDAFPSTGCPHLAQTVVSVMGDDGRRGRLRFPGR